MEAVCDQCHGCHRANTCPIEATVYGFWRDVELQHVELLAQGAAATAAAAAAAATAAAASGGARRLGELPQLRVRLEQ